MSDQPPRDKAFIDRLKTVRLHIKDNWSLCDFMGKCEREDLVAQTVCAAVLNVERLGEAFSWKGNNLDRDDPSGLCDSGTAYRWLVDCGYFEEATRDGKPVIFPTGRLVARLEGFFAKKVVAA